MNTVHVLYVKCNGFLSASELSKGTWHIKAVLNVACGGVAYSEMESDGTNVSQKSPRLTS